SSRLSRRRIGRNRVATGSASTTRSLTMFTILAGAAALPAPSRLHPTVPTAADRSSTVAARMSTPDEPTPPSDEARTRVLEQPPPPPRPPSRSLPGGPWPWLVGVLLVVVAGVLLAVFLTRGSGNASASRVSVPGLI